MVIVVSSAFTAFCFQVLNVFLKRSELEKKRKKKSTMAFPCGL